ncbi:synaptogyrin-2b [Gouania willdenowi]|uniref:Synaptogyrin n=1 Tax=Gouania willdenowi TaxID=441366 RepID=A0A8C5EA78_GOUWI|nr:synaptogyrin-1-like [Gouania willdenowi]
MERNSVASVYDSVLAGRGFDLQTFIRQPLTIVRVLSWVFAIVVFGTITAEGYINPSNSKDVLCVFNQNASACQYAVTIGVLGFLACVAFLLLDVYVPFMTNMQEKKYAVMADLGFSGVWTFLWFVCFCLLANQWSYTHDVRGIPVEAARATIAFCFFSIATWAILTYFALCRFHRGGNEVAIPTYTETTPPPPDQTTPYPPTYTPTSYNPTTYTPTTYAYPSNVPDMTPQPSLMTNVPPQGDYQPPSY